MPFVLVDLKGGYVETDKEYGRGHCELRLSKQSGGQAWIAANREKTKKKEREILACGKKKWWMRMDEIHS